jgi:rod shape-determining protein MreC
MPASRWARLGALRPLRQAWPWLSVLVVLLAIRLSKGAGLVDLYALVSRPFWPGSAQGEWLRSAARSEQELRLSALERDNRRLRRLLELQQDTADRLRAPVISREPVGWWQQLVLGAGSLAGLRPGQAVLAPGGLIGRISAVTPSTARVTLLTDPSSRVGVWVARSQTHGLLSGVGTGRPQLRFLEKDPQVRPGDVVVTSPASTLVPPNLPVGVIQTLEMGADPAPAAVVQLSAPLEAVDWVQVVRP